MPAIYHTFSRNAIGNYKKSLNFLHFSVFNALFGFFALFTQKRHIKNKAQIILCISIGKEAEIVLWHAFLILSGNLLTAAGDACR